MTEVRGEIRKLDADRQLVFGWGYVVAKADGTQVVDHSGDVMDPGSLEDSVYDYVLESRDGGEMHVAKGVSRLVESFVVTPEKLEKMGVAPDSLPSGWWIGFRVDDDAVWKRVKDGELAMFSIGGTGTREELSDA